MEVKASRSGSRGPYYWGGLRDRGPGSYICELQMKKNTYGFKMFQSACALGDGKTRKDRLFLVSIYLGTCGDDRHPALAGAYTP
jgi:hypothetical protein